jgi:hypothetical protein
MRMTRILWTAVAAQFVFCALLSGQSIADVARKERERQKQVQSKVTVTSRATTTGAASTPATAAVSAPAGKGVEVTDNKGRDEKYWRTAFQKAREDAKRADDRVLALELKLKDLNMQFLNRSDIYNKENQLGPLITTAQKDLDQARITAAQAKQQISDLEEELRRSGGLAGWAR